jgi:hypothetical protein
MDADQDSIYEQMLGVVGQAGLELRGRQLCLFCTQIGVRWSNDLLVCGRAVNGWNLEWSPSRALTEDSRSQLMAEIRDCDAKDGAPMEWVAEAWQSRQRYNTARSAFWRVIRAVANALELEGFDQLKWSSYLAWTNLYHLALGTTGNPPSRLMRLQLPLCLEQLQRDLRELQPKRVLFLTGMNWAAPFLGAVTFTSNTPLGLVEASGWFSTQNSARASVIVAKHPQGKPHDDFVQAVVRAFTAVA